MVSVGGALGVGLSRAAITPPRGSYLIGYGDRYLGARGVHDDLMVTALVLTHRGISVVVVALDLLCLHEDVVARIRSQIARRTEIPAHHVLLACSHTHAGPIAWAGPGSSRRRRRLIDRLVEKVSAVVTEAAGSVAPASLHFGVGRAPIAVNRRERKSDGRIEIGVDRDGPVDPALAVLQIRDAAGTLRATLIHLACHPAVLSPKNRLISADWPGAMRREIEFETRVPCLFLQGATGDLNPDHEWGPDDFAAVETIGRNAAAAALDRCKEGLEPIEGVPLAGVREDILLPVRLRRARNGDSIEDYRVTGARLLGLPRFAIGPLLRYAYPWRPRLQVRADGGCDMPMELQTVRIGDLLLVAHAAETFCEIGAAIRRQSPAPHTLVLGYSNGCVGYLPTAAACAEGGYEVEQAPLAYRISGTYEPGCESLVIARSLDQVRSLLD